MARRQPVIAIDATKDWPAFRFWTPDYLSSVLKDKLVVVRESNDGHFDLGESLCERTMSFEQAAQLITDTREGRHIYIQQQPISQRLPELFDDVRVPEWIAGGPQEPHFWFGSRSVSPLHFDQAHNFFVQVYGEKEFTIFSPSDTKNLYPPPLGDDNFHMSQVRLDALDLTKHPRFRLATPMRFTMKPGEMLFLPAYWWHHVHSPGTAISVNFWWSPSPVDHVASQNSLRAFFQMYESDRLAAVKRNDLVPNGLDFASAAALLLNADHRWGAALLAVAAFDEALDSVRAQRGLECRGGCPVRRLGEDIRQSCAELGESGPIPQRYARVAKHIESMAHELSLGNEVDVSISATAQLVAEVQCWSRPD